MRVVREGLLLLGLLSLSVLAGCSSSSEPVLTTVTGTATLNNQPLAGATLRFLPQGTTPGHGGAGKTDAEGKFEVIAVRSNKRKGLVPGDYKVVVTRLLMPDGSPPPRDVPPIESGAHESVPVPYCKPHLSPLAVTVGSEPVTFDCALKN